MPENLKTRFHFSDFIKEEMDERGWSIQELAIRMHWKEIGLDILALEFLMACPDVTLDDESAGRMALAFGVSKEFLVNLDKSCRQSREEAGLRTVEQATK